MALMLRRLLLPVLMLLAAAPAADALTLAQPAGRAACVDHRGAGGCARGVGTNHAVAAVVSPDGRHVYVVAGMGAHGALTSFARDRRTGALRQLPGKAGCTSWTGRATEVTPAPQVCARAPGLGFLEHVAISSDGRTIYTLSGGGSDQSQGIGVFRRDPATGRVTHLQCVSPAAGDEGCTQGALQGPRTVALSRDGRTLYAGGESLSTFPLGPDGRIEGTGTCAMTLEFEGEGLCAGARKANSLLEIMRMTVSRDGRRLYAVASGDPGSQLQAYDLGPGGAPSPAGCAGVTTVCRPARAIHEAEDLDVSPDGRAVYTASTRTVIADEVGPELFTGTSAVGVFAAGAGGPVTQLAGRRGCAMFGGRSPNPGCATDRRGLTGASAVAVTRDGRHVVAAFGESEAVALLRRDPSTHALTPVAGRRGCVGGGGCARGRGIGLPTDIALAPDGRHAYSVNGEGLAVLRLAP